MSKKEDQQEIEPKDKLKKQDVQRAEKSTSEKAPLVCTDEDCFIPESELDQSQGKP
ncbi:MAG: hypothetical protein H7Y36_05250 [Armatimonadetes bacterium]|nr:hypothetical protein [Akkermansiaceae bacterium]